MSEPGQAFVDKVVDLATASEVLQELELMKQRVTEKVAAAATAAVALGAPSAAAAAVAEQFSPTTPPVAGSREAKRSRIDGKDEVMPDVADDTSQGSSDSNLV